MRTVIEANEFIDFTSQNPLAVDVIDNIRPEVLLKIKEKFDAHQKTQPQPQRRS